MHERFIQMQLDNLEGELKALKAWCEESIITEAEKQVQVTTLLEAKVPLTETHSAASRKVLEALKSWRHSGLMSDDDLSMRRAAVLRVAAGVQLPRTSTEDSLPGPLLPPAAAAAVSSSSSSTPSQPARPQNLSFAKHREPSSGKRPSHLLSPLSIPDETHASSGGGVVVSDGDSNSPSTTASHSIPTPPKSSSSRTRDALNQSFAANRRRLWRSSHDVTASPAQAGSSGSLTYSPKLGMSDGDAGGGGGGGGGRRGMGLQRRSRSSRESAEETASRLSRRNRQQYASYDGADEISTDLTDLIATLDDLRSEKERRDSMASFVKGNAVPGLGLLSRAKTRTNFMQKATELLEQDERALSALERSEGNRSNGSASSFSRRSRKRLRRALHHTNGCLPVFEPEARLVTLWQLGIFAFVITSAIVVPLAVAFETEMQISVRDSLKLMDKVFDVAFIIDMFVSCNIAFREDGFLVRVRRLVVMKYLRGWFALDLVSSFPLSWILEGGDGAGVSMPAAASSVGGDSGAGEVAKINKLLRLVKLGKLLRILKLFKIFDQLANEMSFNPASFRLLGLAFGLFFIAHLFGCLWYMVISWSGGTLDEYASYLASIDESGALYNSRGAMVGLGGGAGSSASAVSSPPTASGDAFFYPHGSRYPLDELIQANALGPDGVGRKWLLCFTMAMGMFTGLMPVEMHPWRPEEMSFCIVALVCAMAFNAMIISSCSSAMQAMDYVARHHKAKLDRVRDYMRFNRVPSELSTRILDYYRYICVNSQTKDDVKDFVDLPQQLHFKLIIALHRDLITKCPLFVEFDNNSILRILTFLRPFTIPPETVVLRQDNTHTAMYFVSRGMLWIVDLRRKAASDGSPLRVGNLGDHDFFGDEGVLSGRLPEYSVVSKSYCVLMALTRADFESANPKLKGQAGGGLSGRESSRSARGDAGRILTIVEAIKRKRSLVRTGTGQLHASCARQSSHGGGGDGTFHSTKPGSDHPGLGQALPSPRGGASAADTGGGDSGGGDDDDVAAANASSMMRWSALARAGRTEGVLASSAVAEVQDVEVEVVKMAHRSDAAKA